MSTGPFMSMATLRESHRNRLLAIMSPDDYAILEPLLERVTLKQGQVLEVPNKPIEYVYFIENGVVSVVVVNAQDHRIEVGVVGLDGMTGVPVILGDDRSSNSTYMQIGGDGYRIPVAAFRAALEQSVTLKALLMRCARAFLQPARQALLQLGALAADGARPDGHQFGAADA